MTLQHPGCRFILCAEPTSPLQHVGSVEANRETIGGWEAFRLEPVTGYDVPGRIRTQAGLLLDLATPGGEVVDLYSRLGCDALGAQADVPPLDRLMSSFESLGDNCEFGFAQRLSHTEPLELLRFAGGLGANGLAAALRQRFVGLGQADTMTCTRHPHIENDYDVFESVYGIGYHTIRTVDTDPATIVAEEAVKLVYLRDKLFEDLEDAEKIFVFKANGMPPDADILNLLSAMHEFGRPTLLSVVLSDLEHPPGTVIKLADGLLRGFIDRFAPYEAAWDARAPSWIRICRNAYAMSRA